ncbi:MAG: DUF1517 domain-containing protein [Chloroflexota bacterium]
MRKRDKFLFAAFLGTTLLLDFAVPALAFGGGVGGGSSFGGGGGGFGGGGGLPIGGGGGFGLPMFFPMFGFGGGIVPILLFLLFIWLSRRGSMTSGRGAGTMLPSRSSDVNLIKLEIGLLATAKDVPTALHRLVASIDTSTNLGLSQLLQQSALLLLRNQQYWHAANYGYRKVRYSDAEPAFNSLTMQARSKLSYETITNVGGTRQVDTDHLPAPVDSIAPGDYIVVVLIVASSASLHLREARTADEVREQVAEIAAGAGSNLEAVQVIWHPDSTDESLSRDDLMTLYPELAPI